MCGTGSEFPTNVAAVHLWEGLSRSHAHSRNILRQGWRVNDDAILGMKNLPKLSWKSKTNKIQGLAVNLNMGGRVA